MRFHIALEEFSFYTIIGILPLERQIPQKIVVGLDFEYEYDEGFVDYAVVEKLIKSHIQTNRFELVEEALIETLQLLHKQFPQIKKASLSISKPQILEFSTPKVSLSLKFE